MPELLFRQYASAIERTSPDTLTARLVPYGVPAQVAEASASGVERYVEEFAPGAFRFQLEHKDPRSVAGRIQLRDEHEGGSGKLGAGRALRDTPEALFGDFLVFQSRAPDVEQLLEAGTVAVSIGFHPLVKPLVKADGTHVRTAAFLHHVALVPSGAYPGAEVLSFRDDLEAAEAEVAQVARDAELGAEERRRELAAWLAEQRARNDTWLEKVAHATSEGAH